MFTSRFRRAVCACALPLVLLTGVAIAHGATAIVDSFSSVMEDAVTWMHRDMMVPPSGDVDRDFATMMIPHHQGAVEMAEAELRFGHAPVLRRLAQGIVVEQRQEIAVMRQALAALPPA